MKTTNLLIGVAVVGTLGFLYYKNQDGKTPVAVNTGVVPPATTTNGSGNTAPAPAPGTFSTDMHAPPRPSFEIPSLGAILVTDKKDLGKVSWFCQNNPNDPRCKGMNRSWFCQNNPNDPRCKGYAVAPARKDISFM